MEIVGTGAFTTDTNVRFGQIFKNESSTSPRTNYLKLPSTLFEDFNSNNSKSAMSIGFWVNAGNMAASAYTYAPFFSAYAAAPSSGSNGSPMFIMQSRGTLQVNMSDGRWCDFTGAQNTNKKNSIYNTNSWEAGDAAYVNGGNWIDDGAWHYVTIVMTSTNAKVYLDGVIKNEWNIDGSSDGNVNGIISGGSALTYACLGGNQAWNWGDNDAGFAFDDFALYDVALSAEQIQQIVTAKFGPHTWSAKAYAIIDNVKTEIDSWTGSNFLKGASYNVWAKRVIQYGGKYYELDDNKFFGSSTSFSATMGTVDVEYEISYTLNEDIVYYSEGEVFGQNTASETASGGAFCNYYAGPTTVSGLTANQVYRLETNVVGRNDKSSLEIYQTEGTASFAKIDKNHGTGYNTIYFTPTETSVRVGGPYYSGKFQNSLSFDYILIRKYDIVNPAGILGTLDKASSWTQSDAYTLKQGETKVFTFKNHGYGVDDTSEKSWYNWVVYMYEGETSKAETRADFWDNKKGDNLGYQAMSTDGGSTKTWVDWSKFREDMDDAVVVATLTYQNGTYSISAESTAAKSGYIYYVEHSVTDLTGDLTIKISIDHSWMEMLSEEKTAGSLTLNSSGYTTFSHSSAIQITGATAYTATVDEDKSLITLTPIEDGIIPANTGVILKGEASASVSYVATTTDKTITTNDLHPAVTAIARPAGNIFVLSGDAFQALDESVLTFTANKAYLVMSNTFSVSSGANVRMAYADETTGIDGWKAKKAEDGAVYNMAGQAVNGSYNGIVIKNGKKYLNK